MADKRGMGRGLAAILSVSEAGDGDAAELREVAVELIAPEPRPAAQALRRGRAPGARRTRSAERGVLQPVLVRPRRAAATSSSPASAAGAPRSSPASRRMPALVQRRDDGASLEVALIENMAREDLNPVEEARAVAALVEELGLTREEVGRRVGRSRVAISNLLRLLDLPDEALELVEAGRPDRGPRPRAPARRRPRRAPPARARGGRGRLVGARARGDARARRTPAPRAAPAAAAPPCIPTRRRRSPEIADALSARARRRGPRPPARDRLPGRARLRQRRRGARPGARRSAPRARSADGRYTAARHGRLAQSVRALL